MAGAQRAGGSGRAGACDAGDGDARKRGAEATITPLRFERAAVDSPGFCLVPQSSAIHSDGAVDLLRLNERRNGYLRQGRAHVVRGVRVLHWGER